MHHSSSSSGFFLGNCASSAPVGLWHPWICGDLLCLHVPQGVFLLPWSSACSLACMDFSGSVLCAECRPVFCDHPCSY